MGFRKVRAVMLLTALASMGAAAAPPPGYSGNPVFPGWYADPEAAIFNDTYWIYPTTSLEYAAQRRFDAFSSPDLVHWTKHADVLGDLRQIRLVNGVPKIPDDASREGHDGRQRHADAAIAGMLAYAASRADPIEYGYTAAPLASRRDDAFPTDDDTPGGRRFGRGAF